MKVGLEKEHIRLCRVFCGDIRWIEKGHIRPPWRVSHHSDPAKRYRPYSATACRCSKEMLRVIRITTPYRAYRLTRATTVSRKARAKERRESAAAAVAGVRVVERRHSVAESGDAATREQARRRGSKQLRMSRLYG